MFFLEPVYFKNPKEKKKTFGTGGFFPWWFANWAISKRAGCGAGPKVFPPGKGGFFDLPFNRQFFFCFFLLSFSHGFWGSWFLNGPKRKIGLEKLHGGNRERLGKKRTIMGNSKNPLFFFSFFSLGGRYFFFFPFFFFSLPGGTPSGGALGKGRWLKSGQIKKRKFSGPFFFSPGFFSF